MLDDVVLVVDVVVVDVVDVDVLVVVIVIDVVVEYETSPPINGQRTNFILFDLAL